MKEKEKEESMVYKEGKRGEHLENDRENGMGEKQGKRDRCLRSRRNGH